MTDAQLLKVLAQFVAKHKSQREAARSLGISQGYFNDMLHGRRPPSDELLAAVGLQRVVTYKRAAAA